MGVGQSRSRRGPRVSELKINEVFSYGFFDQPHSKLIKLKLHGQKSIFTIYACIRISQNRVWPGAVVRRPTFELKFFLGAIAIGHTGKHLNLSEVS